jgi:hypothetical protein
LVFAIIPVLNRNPTALIDCARQHFAPSISVLIALSTAFIGLLHLCDAAAQSKTSLEMTLCKIFIVFVVFCGVAL